MLNLNDTTPAAQAGYQNGVWQEDSSGNASVAMKFQGFGGKTTIAPVAGALTVDCSLANSFYINVNAAITSMNITNPVDGQEITLLWVQDGTGHAIVLAGNLQGATAPTASANKVSCQKFTYNTGNGNWYAVSAGVTNM
jgi:hypothetical protein